MGEDINSQFSQEELVILGEVEAPQEAKEGAVSEAQEQPKEEAKGEPEGEAEATEEKAPEPTEQAAEEKTESATGGKEESQEDEEETEQTKVQKRINQLTWERKETERKLDLLKRLGPERYFEVYPEERPKDADKRPETSQSIQTDRVLSFSEAQHLRVQGGTYNGLTLAEVYQQDPTMAFDMYLDLRDRQKTAVDNAKMSHARLREES